MLRRLFRLLLAVFSFVNTDGLGLAGLRQERLLSNREEQSLANTWDLEAAMRDEPPGAYLALISVLAQAETISHWASHGPWYDASHANSTVGFLDGNKDWQRIFELDTDPTLDQTGIHAYSFVNHKQKRAILAIRGSCIKTGIRGCDADSCFLLSIRSFGNLSAFIFGNSSTDEEAWNKRCAKYDFTSKDLDYYSQTDDLLQRLQERFPGYAVLMTGHSMGGHLAAVTAAKHVGKGVQAFTFAPSPFHTALEELKLTSAQTTALPKGDIIALCDPYDCGVNTVLVPEARAGTQTCVYDKWNVEPAPCYGVKALVQDARLDPSEVFQSINCKGKSHDWMRYAQYFQGEILHNSGPSVLPTCGETFSHLTPGLISAMRFMQVGSKVMDES